jgi:hypothetical protein
MKYINTFLGSEVRRVLICSSSKFYFLSTVTFRISISHMVKDLVTTVFSSHTAPFNRRTETRHLNACHSIREEGYGSVSANIVIAYFQFDNDFLSSEKLLITAVISWRFQHFLYSNYEIQVFFLHDKERT